MFPPGPHSTSGPLLPPPDTYMPGSAWHGAESEVLLPWAGSPPTLHLGGVKVWTPPCLHHLGPALLGWIWGNPKHPGGWVSLPPRFEAPGSGLYPPHPKLA